jgi:hypothetical protein
MKKYFGFILAFSLVVFSSCSSVSPKNDTSQLRYTYARLKVMDLDQMNDLMLEQAREFKKSNDPQALKEGLLICLSRPDEDALVDKVIDTVKTPLEDNGLWESTVQGLIEESVAAIKDSSRSSADQVTYSIVLENLISDLRPEFIKQYKSPGFESRMIEKIAATEVELNAPARAERKLNLMKSGTSPAQIAKRLLDKREEVLKSEKSEKSEKAPEKKTDY